ncbi:MCE family protein [Rhodococcus sp. D2-41]|uniref:MCE family protein n=1 Tax=Speluncibacter jeojiensis TaxID=2710754 RepID=A0A9X4M2I1_9ACTN|nr:MlaD family protein [Rhodococcus sp. D2-41]MDG3010678.1 MCE family protein [Rhodococcus sp. D2-41]MDG3016858.1 MCE family protein [Corynebacteriales bacterium D3-21]
MMLTRFVRAQLAVFAVLAIVGMALVGVDYVKVPAALGIGNYTVTLNLPASGGLYRFSNVTYRGINVGQVSAVSVVPDGVRATLRLRSSTKIPRSVQVRVRSMSAIGEQYVDLLPSSTAGPYLHDGEVLTVPATALPTAIGPLLDRAQTLLDSVPQDRLREVIDESFRAFGGQAPAMSKLLDSTVSFVNQTSDAAEPTRDLVQRLGPLLDDQAVTSSEIRTWVSGLADITGQVQAADPHVQSLLQSGPATAQSAQDLLAQVQPTLPVLLKNLTSVGQVLLTYNPAIEQIMLLLPPLEAAQTTVVQTGAPDGAAAVDFVMEANDPAACTTGYLPASARRSPTDFSIPDTPSDLYCKVPRDSKFAVRGSRNLPCLAVPGKRAPTPQECASDKPYTAAGTNAPDEIDPAPAVGTTGYNPADGTYVGPDGKTYRVDTPPDGRAPAWPSLLTK